MVAAIDWCSHTTHDWIWLVSCFGFNGPLRQYFSLYRAVSQRVRKKREKMDESKNVQTTPIRTYCKCKTIYKMVSDGDTTLKNWLKNGPKTWRGNNEGKGFPLRRHPRWRRVTRQQEG